MRFLKNHDFYISRNETYLYFVIKELEVDYCHTWKKTMMQ